MYKKIFNQNNFIKKDNIRNYFLFVLDSFINESSDSGGKPLLGKYKRPLNVNIKPYILNI